MLTRRRFLTGAATAPIPLIVGGLVASTSAAEPLDVVLTVDGYHTLDKNDRRAVDNWLGVWLACGIDRLTAHAPDYRTVTIEHTKRTPHSEPTAVAGNVTRYTKRITRTAPFPIAALHATPRGAT